MPTVAHFDANYSNHRDIVDTEPFQNGNTWKMLLGAIDPWFDDDDTPPSSTVELPASSWGLRKI
jgi:hypothetical protein